MNKEKMKQSLLMGALTSSFGIFVSKLLGLLYYSPLSSIAGEANMAFYSFTYTYYDLLLQVSQAGIPFATASLVANYIAKDDYKTVLLVKNAGTSIIMGLTVAVALFFVLFAEPLARQTLGIYAPVEDIRNLKALFHILTVAVTIVPLLSSIRGYIQPGPGTVRTCLLHLGCRLCGSHDHAFQQHLCDLHCRRCRLIRRIGRLHLYGRHGKSR